MHVGCYIALLMSYLVAALAYGLLLVETFNHAEPSQVGEETVAAAPSEESAGAAG